MHWSNTNANLEDGVVEEERVFHGLLVGELEVREAFAFAGPLVALNGDPVDRAAARKMLLELAWRSLVVHL